MLQNFTVSVQRWCFSPSMVEFQKTEQTSISQPCNGLSIPNYFSNLILNLICLHCFIENMLRNPQDKVANVLRCATGGIGIRNHYLPICYCSFHPNHTPTRNQCWVQNQKCLRHRIYRTYS